MRLIESRLWNGSWSVNFLRKSAMASFAGMWCCIQRSSSTVAMWALLVGIQRDLNAPRIAIWKMISVDKSCALLNSRRLPIHFAFRSVSFTLAKGSFELYAILRQKDRLTGLGHLFQALCDRHFLVEILRQSNCLDQTINNIRFVNLLSSVICMTLATNDQYANIHTIICQGRNGLNCQNSDLWFFK